MSLVCQTMTLNFSLSDLSYQPSSILGYILPTPRCFRPFPIYFRLYPQAQFLQVLLGVCTALVSALVFVLMPNLGHSCLPAMQGQYNPHDRTQINTSHAERVNKLPLAGS
jgi:hypothetical protein